MPVMVGALGMIKKETDKHIKKIPGCASFCVYKKSTLQNCSSSLESTINVTEKYYPKEAAKSINP